jgi:transcriptional regulator with XRE-family HTH domain
VTSDAPEETGPSELGMLVRARREEKGLSQEQLAELMGCSHAYVSQLERKPQPWFSKKFMRPLSDALNIPMSLILELEGLLHRKPGDPLSEQQQAIALILKMEPRQARLARRLLLGVLEDAEQEEPEQPPEDA